MKTKSEAQELLQTMQKQLDRADGVLKQIGDVEQKGVSKIMKGSSASFPVVGGESTDEKQAMRYFGVNHPAQLIAVNTADPKFHFVPENLKLLVRDLKKSVDTARYIAQIWHDAPKDKIGASEGADAIARVKNILDTKFGRNDLAARLKAFGSTSSGAGDEWVPTLLSSNYIEEYQIQPVLEQRFQKINMPSNPYDQAVQHGLKKARLIAENAQISDTTFTTAKLTFTAKKIGEHHILPEEMTEDSAPDIMAAARDHVIMSQLRAVESAIINGDDDGTHIDSDTQAAGADVAEKLWKGLRRQALANSANGSTTDFTNAAITEANLRTMRARMKKFGSNPEELLLLCGPVAYTQLLALPSVITMEKYGPMATVLKGALAAYQAIPIVNSEHMREDLNASGVYDGVTVNRASILLVNLKRWYVGIRRPIVVKAMADLPYYDRFLLASYQRKDFQGMPQDAVELSVSLGYNIAV
jgi:hypothetical protein